MYIAQLDITGLQQSKVTLSSCLNSYINNHHLPVKLFQRMGNFYLMRLDVDDKGNAIENWETIQLQKHIDDSAVEITPAEVAKHALKTK
jgi:hypothetical protein